MRYLPMRGFCLALAVLSGTAFAHDDPRPGDPTVLRKAVEITDETSLSARVKLSTGHLFIENGSRSQAFRGEFVYRAQAPDIRYDVVGRRGELDIRLEQDGDDLNVRDYDGRNIHFDEDYDNEVRLSFARSLPLDLDLELGVIKGDLDFGGLQLRECEVKSAVSDAKIDFGDPNPIPMRYLNIESGVGNLRLYRLGNANAEEMRFEGGVGSYELDFSGDLRRSADVDIEIGMGKLRLELPRSVGVRLRIDESLFSSVDIDDVYKSGDSYFNERWKSSEIRLDIVIDSGLSKVEVHWVD